MCHARSDGSLGNERLLSMPVKTCCLVETKGSIVVAPRHEHYLVAALRPGKLKRALEKRFSPTFLPMGGVRYDVFDDRIRPASSREIGDDHDRATAHKLVFGVSAEIATSLIG